MTEGPWLLITALGVAAMSAVLGWALTGHVLRWVQAQQVLAHPDARSSHTVPTPVGGGLAVMAVTLAAGGLLSLRFERVDLAVLTSAALMLTAVSWVDDRRGLPPLTRLLAQAVAVMAGLAVLSPMALAFQGVLPLWADRALLAFAWLWFVNLYNFIDGIDGITGSVTGTICFGIGMVVVAAPLVEPALVLQAAAIGGAALGFLVLNWHPARLFLGDVGSVPLGYIIGGLLILLATQGLWAAALILPAYSVGDATVTLLQRLAGGARVWQPHREHFYQRATRRGLSHAAVVRRVLAVQAVLVVLAAASLGLPTAGQIACVLAAMAGVLAALRWLAPFRVTADTP